IAREANMNRREFLYNTAAVGVVTAASAKSLSQRAIAAGLPGPYQYTPFSKEFSLPEPVSLGKVEAMSPQQIAESSALVRSAYQELHKVASCMKKQEYRAIMSAVLKKPKLNFMTDLYRPPADRKAIFDEMVKLKYFIAEDSPDYIFPPGVEHI